MRSRSRGRLWQISMDHTGCCRQLYRRALFNPAQGEQCNKYSPQLILARVSYLAQKEWCQRETHSTGTSFCDTVGFRTRTAEGSGSPKSP